MTTTAGSTALAQARTARGSAVAIDPRVPAVVPRAVARAALWCLDAVAARLDAAGISANAVTRTGLVLGALAGALLALGAFGWATVVMIAASLCDAVDGLVARRSGSASRAGALLDAATDRYEEFLLLGGIAVYVRGSLPMLVLTLAALVGSFMVSYGSAKAEAFGVAVPAGAMRRAERALCLCVGVAATATLSGVARSLAAPAWCALAPLAAALAVIAVVANVSAVRRLRSIAGARGLAPATALAPVPATTVNGAAPVAPKLVTAHAAATRRVAPLR